MTADGAYIVGERPYEPLTLTRADDGRTLLPPFIPTRTAFSLALLEPATSGALPTDGLSLDGDTVTLAAANGTVQYRITARDDRIAFADLVTYRGP